MDNAHVKKSGNFVESHGVSVGPIVLCAQFLLDTPDSFVVVVLKRRYIYRWYYTSTVLGADLEYASTNVPS